MWAQEIYTLALASAVILALAAFDFKNKSIENTTSYFLEGVLGLCIFLNFYFDWELTALLAGVGLAFYVVAMPGMEKILPKRYNYKFYQLDKEIFILTLVGWPFISLFAFLGNQLANIFYAVLKRHFTKWGKEMPQLVVYGIIWFLLSAAVLILFIH